MFEIKLKDLLMVISKNTGEDWMSTSDEERVQRIMLPKIMILGKDNLHIPDFDFNSLYDKREAESLLTGEEIIYGDFLYYDYCGHLGRQVLIQCDTLEELEEDIIQSFPNRFTTALVPIVYGKVKTFELHSTGLVHEKGKNDNYFFNVKNKKVFWLD